MHCDYVVPELDIHVKHESLYSKKFFNVLVEARAKVNVYVTMLAKVVLILSPK